MTVIKGNIWDYHKKGHWITITTNGIIGKNGNLIMGAGIALEAKRRFPDLPFKLGSLIRNEGNQPYILQPEHLITFPTKQHYQEKSTPELIYTSAVRVRDLLNITGIQTLYMTKPGCQLGGLKWEVVEPVLDKVFQNDKRVIICDLK